MGCLNMMIVTAFRVVNFSSKLRLTPGVQARFKHDIQAGRVKRVKIGELNFKTSPAEVTQIKLAVCQAEPSAIGFCILRQPFQRSVAVTQDFEVLVVVVQGSLSSKRSPSRDELSNRPYQNHCLRERRKTHAYQHRRCRVLERSPPC